MLVKYLKNLVSYQPSVSGIGIEYNMDVEWSDEEKVLLDSERGMLIVRMPYTTNLQQVVAKKFTDYLVSNVSGIKLLDQISYKARYYRGKPGVPQYIAIFEVE